MLSHLHFRRLAFIPLYWQAFLPWSAPP